MIGFATLETRRELEPKYVSRNFLRIFTGDEPVSYWPIFFPVLSNRHSPRSLCAVNSVAFSFRFQSDEFERKSFCVMAPMGLIVVLQFTSETFLLCKKVTSAIGALRRIGPLIAQSTPLLVYNSLIQPHFDYCSLFWNGLSEQLSDKLQKLQNRVARANLKANYGTSSSLLLDIAGFQCHAIQNRLK